MCAPVASTSQASAQDRNLRSARTSLPARRTPAARGPGPAPRCGTGRPRPPAGCRSRSPPPRSRRGCGNAPSSAPDRDQVRGSRPSGDSPSEPCATGTKVPGQRLTQGHWAVRGGRGRSLLGRDPVPQIYDAVVESALLQQFKVQPRPFWEKRNAAAEGERVQQLVDLIHQPRLERMGTQR
jgi:hypothetical protein